MAGFFMGFPFGEARRNQPIDIKPANPLPPNQHRSDCGDAGLDGYSVLSRANANTGARPPVEGSPEYWGPNQAQEQ